jgi:hypothetical protein
LDHKITEVLLPLGISTDIPPPLLFDGTPLAAMATVTEQLLNVDDCMLTLANATLLVCTAPPPPLALPGRTDIEFVTTEQAEKLHPTMNNVTLNPPNFSAWMGQSMVPLNVDTWGECSTDRAPPYTEVVPREVVPRVRS